MTDYLRILSITAFEHDGFTPFLSLMFLCVARLFPIILLTPFFGAKVLPHPVKVTLALSMFIIFLPLLVQVTTTPVDFNLWLMVLMAKEFFIGLILGFMMSLPFFVVQNAGIIIDHQRGGASLMVNDPSMQSQSSPLGTLFNQVLIFIFFAIGGPFMFIEAITTSFELIPPDRLLSAQFFNSEMPFWQEIFNLYNKLMILSVQMAAPGLIMILMTDVFLGIVNRLAPQIQITFLGLPLKSLLAMSVVCVGWKAITDQFVLESYKFLRFVNDVIIALGAGT